MNIGVYIIALFVVLFINYIIANHMKFVATLKGYGDDAHAWAMCFWLGIIGCIYVAALPDKIAQSQNQQIIELLKGKSE